jgi:VanZ family protein
VFALALYNRSLSSEEVSRNYEGWITNGLPAVSIHGGLVGLFTFLEKSGERAVNQLASESILRIPRYFQPLQREILIPPWKDLQFKRSYLLDMLVNCLGFVPFGLLFSAWSSRSFGSSLHRAVLFTVAFSTALSLSIELLQAWIPLRDSQMMDVLMNTSGAVVGSLVVGCFGRARVE